MSWPFETSEAFITPDRGTELQRRMRGATFEEWALPPILVATFQKKAYRRLLERAGADAGRPGNRGERSLGDAGGAPCALARFGVGAPAAALLLEDSVARVRGIRAALIVAVSDELFGDEWNAGFGEAAYLNSLVRAADSAMDAAEEINAGPRGIREMV